MKKKLPIIAAYFEGETYGLLGPQLAATIIQANTSYDCIVIGVSRQDDTVSLKRAIADFWDQANPVIAFSTLCGREDLYHLAGELKKEGALTLLAGPQAHVDYKGETGWIKYPHRFKGLSNYFSYALHGPAEKFIPFFKQLDHQQTPECHELISKDTVHLSKDHSTFTWKNEYFKTINWNNLYRLEKNRLVPHKIHMGQVIQQIGCPYASLEKKVFIDPPSSIGRVNNIPIELKVSGCSFCDVALDKGFFGTLDSATVLGQIRCLPMGDHGRKIPFELINENPLPGLKDLLSKTIQSRIPISQINLTMRADWLVKGQKHLDAALKIAQNHEIKIIMGSIGFESFDDRILKNLNKGVKSEINLKAVRILRQVKSMYPKTFGYLRNEGGNHGMILPTPWDTPEIESNIMRVIKQYDLSSDILPDHSIPLIIHHASPLGEWIRLIEIAYNIEYKRIGSIIGWWEEIKWLS